MTDKPNATLTDDLVWDILLRLHKIDNGNPDTDTQAKIANAYGVEKKTISRIKTGKTWRSLKQRFDEQSSVHFNRSVEAEEGLRTENMIADIGGAKETFGLDTERPLHFGRYEWYDGVHWIASDGFILWESLPLYDLAVRAEASGIKGYPVFAHKACELPTFKLSDIMTRPVGDTLVKDLESGDGWVRLISDESKTVFIKSQYMEIAERQKFDINLAGYDLDFVYFTQTKTTRHTEDIVIFACVATMEIQ